MIESIRLRNYRGHADTTIPLGPFSVLVGENAVGKTSVLSAIDWISRGIYNGLSATLLRRGQTELEVALRGSGPLEAVRLDEGSLAVEHGDVEGWSITAGYRLGSPGDASLLRVRADVTTDKGDVARRPNVSFLSLNAEQLAAPSSSKLVVPQLDRSGGGLASVLAYLKLAETDRFDRIAQRLRDVVPSMKAISFGRLRVEEKVPRLLNIEHQQVALPDASTMSILDALFFDFVDADRVPAELASEGTLVTLGILTALELFHREREPRIEAGVLRGPVDVVLVDDLDRALHPRAQRKLIETLKTAVAVTPNLQIIATSHSPYLLDSLTPDEVVVLGRRTKGEVVAKRLDAFPDQRLQKMLATGELWMSEGEDWVVNGN